MKATRYEKNPIITLDMGDLEGNINGPSVIRVPEWLPDPLGKYYMYFAHHNGTYIRLAYADAIEGPWTVYAPGTLKLEQAYAIKHVASPDAHVDNSNQEIRMYYHSPVPEGGQRTRVAISKDGINFTACPEILGQPYFRVIQWQGYRYALGMPGIFYRSKDGLTGFEEGPTLFGNNMRHSALKRDSSTLSVFYSIAGESPESILVSKITLTDDWMNWKASEPEVVLQPEMDYEGADVLDAPSKRGAIMERVRQLRDPCIFRDTLGSGKTYLLYSIAGEQGIASAELTD